MLGKKTLVLAGELRKQREAALRGEDYAPEELEMAEFPSGKRQEQPAGVKKELACPECARNFNYEINLANHVKWHDSSVKDKVFLTPPPPPRPQHEIELMLAPLSKPQTVPDWGLQSLISAGD